MSRNPEKRQNKAEKQVRQLLEEGNGILDHQLGKLISYSLTHLEIPTEIHEMLELIADTNKNSNITHKMLEFIENKFEVTFEHFQDKNEDLEEAKSEKQPPK